MREGASVERELARWLAEEAPAQAPDRLVHSARAGVSASTQVRRARLFGWHLPSNDRRIVLAAAALVVVLMAAVILPRLATSQVGNQQPTPPPTPSATPSALPSLTSIAPYSCPRGGGTCLGPLAAGVYASHSFVPSVRYEVPGGWSNTADSVGELDLRYDAGGSHRYADGTTFYDGISLFRRPVAESNLKQEPLAGVGTDAADLANWLAGHFDLVATAPTPVLVGNVVGVRLEISLPTTPRTNPDHCTTDHHEPMCASLFVSGVSSASYGFGLVGPESAVIYLIDLSPTETVMVVIDDVDGVDRAGLIAAATPVVQHLTFTP